MGYGYEERVSNMGRRMGDGSHLYRAKCDERKAGGKRQIAKDGDPEQSTPVLTNDLELIWKFFEMIENIFRKYIFEFQKS